MRFFTLLLDPDGRGIPEEVRRQYEAMPRRRGLEVEWQMFDHAAVLTAWDDVYGDPLVAMHGHYLAAGMVRLDNRADLERWAECECRGLSDLEVVLRAASGHGTKYVPQILGDFCFVAWDRVARAGVAAADVFGVWPLYYAQRHGLIIWASRAQALAPGDGYELRYLTELLTSYAAPPGLSVYAGVHALPPASLATFGRLTPAIRTYWSARDFQVEPEWSRKEPEAIDTCRQLLVESVRRRVINGKETWGQLSGGLDSSSVVSSALWLAERGEISGGLAGTVTYVDRQGTQTDEREYSNAVVERYGVRNEAILDPPMWYDEAYQPIAPDQPGLDFHVQPREQRLREVIREAGGRVLITGYGGDEVFASNLLFFADWFAEGRVAPALREMARLAAIGRVSFWELAYRNALVPLLPESVQSRLMADESPPGSWLEPEAVRKYGSGRGSAVLHLAAGPLGGKHHHAIVTGVQTLQGVVHGGILSDALDVRHPLLYRPLVEFALRLPYQIRSRPYAHRWILREAMRGILPDAVRTRIGKPDTSDVILWSFKTSQARLRGLVETPILADLGLIDPDKLRAAFESSSTPTASLAQRTSLFPTLAIEAWLQIRSGRWPRPSHLSRNSSTISSRSVGGVPAESPTADIGAAVERTPLAG
jgi:asparagine synthase (glutamine-hydrolysing)